MRPAVVAAVGVGLALLAVVARAGQSRGRAPEFTDAELMLFANSDGTFNFFPSMKPAQNYDSDGVLFGGFGDIRAASNANPDWVNVGLSGVGDTGFDFGAWETEYEYWVPGAGYSSPFPGGSLPEGGYVPETNELQNILEMDAESLMQAVADYLEGAEGYRSYIYDDHNGQAWTESQKGNPTIGFGHLVTKDDVARYGWGWTLNDYTEARALLERDVRKNALAPIQAIKVHLTFPQWVSVVSLGFNAGGDGVAKSRFVRALNARDMVKAEWEFKDWNKSTIVKDGVKQKVVNRGLVNRRAKEWVPFTEPGQLIAIAGQNYG
jgi:GH24 family phage-related lysozyme (muramidase)